MAISRTNCTLRNTRGIKKMRNIWTLRNNLILRNTTILRKNNSAFWNTAILQNNSILRNNLILGKTKFSAIPGFCGRPDPTEYRPRSFAPDVISPRAIGEGLKLTYANSVKYVLLLLRFPYFLASLLLRAEWMKLVGNGSSYLTI